MTTILVIEDEAAILENVTEILTLEGFDVLGAPDGRAGVEQALKHTPDLVICDIMMPKLDGYGVLLALQDEPATATTPFIFLTAKTQREAMRQGMELGADDYLTKPFTTGELLTAIETRLEKQTQVAERYEQKLDELRGNIIHMLPHELRTPLVSIMGYSEMLMWDYETLEREHIFRMSESINQASLRLHRLIENFLVYAQIELLEANPARMEGVTTLWVKRPNQLLREVAQAKAEEKGRQADLELALDDEATIQIVMDDFRKIIEELVDNAFKFSQAGTPVRVAAHANQRSFVVQIENQGRGMTLAQINDVGAGMQFERRLHEQQGAGMGLVIAKRLTELHNGGFSITSVPDESTMVEVALALGDA